MKLSNILSSDFFLEISASIRRHPLRTGLTMFGVFWGIFMLVLLLGVGNALQNGAEYEFRDDAVNSIWVFRGQTSIPHKGMQAGRDIRFDNSDYDDFKTKIEGVEHVTGRFNIPTPVSISYNNKDYTFDIRSVHPAHLILENTTVDAGRYINDKDIKEFRKTACIGKIVAETIFGTENPIGNFISINGVEFQIIGTFSDSGSEREMRYIYLPISTAQRVFSTKDDINMLMVTTGDADVKEAENIENRMRNHLASKHLFAPEDAQAIRIRNRVKQFERIMELFFIIQFFTWFVGIGSIIAGVIGVGNIMLIIVKDRTKEIGIRKAIGATPSSVVLMIMAEAVMITASAGYIGLLAGWSVIYALRDVEANFFRNPSVSLPVILSAIVILVIMGALAGLIPAMRAARIQPVVAMRN
jgi:putative ABC transport system permease protein